MSAQSRWASLWTLDPAVAYLNHGSFGACPTAILEKQSELRARLEREPMDFLVRHAPALYAEARAALGQFVGADPDDLAFVPNATTGVNAVVRSLVFSPGDEILTTDHAYGACKKTLDYAASRAGARVVAASVPFPLRSEEEVVSAVLAAVTPQHAARAARPRHEPDGARLPDRAPRGRALGARRGHAGGRRARARDAAARPRAPRRGVLHRRTRTSGSARRRARRSCTCGGTGRRASTPCRSATATRAARRASATSSTGRGRSTRRRR